MSDPAPTTSGGAAGRIATALAAVAGFAAVFAGLPAALIHYIGWPLPDHIPSVAELTSNLDTGGDPFSAVSQQPLRLASRAAAML